MADQKDRKFHRVAYAVEDMTSEQEKALDRKARWTRIGVSFTLENGYERVRLSPGVSVSGQIILAPPKDDEDDESGA